ncbi:hypothetical protein H2203_004251 [Taxawa tesnikishii (nom. ined.)]|nr:hypothetical protein H2203_004251 [Dothideales sp. JES 119]
MMNTSGPQHVEDVRTLPDAEVVPEVHVHGKTIIVVIATNAIVFSQLFAVIGSGLLAQGTSSLLGDSSKSVWLSTVIAIFTLALNPPLSQAADYWGRRWIIVITSVFGVIGSLVISRAQDIATLIVGFCILGIAFGCQSLLYAVVSEVLPRKFRPLGQASLNITSAIAAVVGILLGGGLLRHNNLENYRIYWYVAAGFYAVGTLGILLGYNPPPRELQALTVTEKLRRLDWVGYCLITIGLTLFSIGLQWSGNPYTWHDAPVLAPFIIGMSLMLGFCVFEWRFKADGLLNHKLFGHRNFPISLFAVFLEGLAFFTTNTYFAFEVSLLGGNDLFEAGLRFIILFAGGVVFSFLVGLYSTKTKSLRGPGIGLGLILTTITVAAQMSTPAELISVTTGLVTACRSLGGAVGLAINSAIFSNTLSSNLPKDVAAAVVPLDFPLESLGELIQALASNDPATIAKVPGATPQIIGAAVEALKEAYSTSFRNTWIAACSFCAVGVVAACFCRNPTSEFNGHIDAPAEVSLVELQKELEAFEIEITHQELKE